MIFFDDPSDVFRLRDSIAVIAVADDRFLTSIKGEESIDITCHAVADDEDFVFLGQFF